MISDASGLLAAMRDLIRFVRAVLCIVAMVLWASSALTQTARTGHITGTVTDPDAAVVTGAPVTVTNQATKVRLTTVTNGRGVYTLPSVEPGRYVVEAHAEGFASSVSAEFVVVAGEPATADLVLVVAGTVVVVAGAGRVDPPPPAPTSTRSMFEMAVAGSDAFT